MKQIALIIGFLLGPHTGLMAQTPAAPEVYKRLTFDQFFDGQIEPIKLSMEIPARYVHAEGLEAPDDSYSYWMEDHEIAGVKETMNLPSKTGYIYGKVSMDVGFDQKTNQFTNEDDLEMQMKEIGMKLIEKKKMRVNGYPILSFIGEAKNGHVMCGMYVGMLIETNTVLVVQVPPGNDLKLGQASWGRIVSSLK